MNLKCMKMYSVDFNAQKPMFLLLIAVCRAEAGPGQSSPAGGERSWTDGRAGETQAEGQRSGAGGGQKCSEPTD